MKAILITALLSTAAFASSDRTFDRTLDVTAAPNVTVNTGSGNVHLHPGSDSQMHISARLHASNNTSWFGSSSSGDVDARMQQIASNPPIHQSGSDVTIGERHNNDLYRNIAINYDITLPRGSSITAGTGSGDVTIEDVGVSLKADTGSGNIRAHGIHGNASLETGSGDIELEETTGGDVHVQTGSGNVHVNGAAADLHAGTGSGDIEIAGNPATDWKLETGSGNIRMNLGSSAHFNLNANTGSGDINIAQPITMQGSLNKHHVTGSVNGGGPVLKAETGSGNIEIN